MNARQRYRVTILPATLVLIAGCSGSPQGKAGAAAGTAALSDITTAAVSYPDAHREEVTDTYHGVEVADPYRWLEDPDSTKARTWIEAQNRLTESYLSKIPFRDSIREGLTKLWNYDSYGTPTLAAGRYFFSKRTGLQNQSVMYWSESLSGEPKVLLDPNQLSDDGTVALANYRISNSGKHFAYALQDAGSDWVEWRVRNVETGQDTTDLIRWSKFYSIAWSHDDSGFFYSRYPEPQEGQALTAVNVGLAVYYHRLGTSQSEDRLVFEKPDQPKWGFNASVTEDGNYLLLSITQGTSPIHRIMYRDLSKHPAGTDTPGPNHGMTSLIDEFEARFSPIGNEGPVFWFHTDLDAPRGRVIEIDLRSPERANWKERIPQREATLRGVSAVGGRLIANYMRDAHTQVIVYDRQGKQLSEVEMPGIGTAFGFQGRKSQRETFYSFSNFVTPTAIYRYDVETGESQLIRKPDIAFDSNQYEVKQVFYQSKDGTRVPMFVTHRRGLKPTGNHPTWLYAYGGFNVSLTPSFNVARAMWLKMGGVLAIPNLRGGGEYGKAWHQAGTKLDKQNVFDDFIAAAEWLIANNYTNSDKLAIEGRSNGGLLVGAVMTQRPELFAVALPAVGVMDMLRFHKFTIGWAWIDDYGSSDDPEQFKALHAYSPYHNLKSAMYPATLVTTADHDDRVVPGHSFKFTAALQEAQTGPKPTLARIETRAGHGAGKPTSMRIAESTDLLAFTAAQLGLSYVAR